MNKELIINATSQGVEIACTTRVDDSRGGYDEGWLVLDLAGFVIPDHAALTTRDATYFNAFRFQYVEQACIRHIQLFSKSLSANSNIDILQ